MDQTSRDLIGDEDFAGEDDLPAAGVMQAVTAPDVLALASLLLAVLSLLGLGLLNGSPYVPELYGGTGPELSLAITASLLGAGLALLPAALGAAALRRLPDDSRFRVIAGAGVLLAAVSVVLRLAVTVRLAMDENLHFVQF